MSKPMSWYRTIDYGLASAVSSTDRGRADILDTVDTGQLAVIIPHIVLLLWLTLLGGKI